MTDDIFQIAEPHEDLLSELKGKLLPDSSLKELADTFKLLSDFTRVKVLYVLSLSELCVQDISELTGVSQSAVSHQLRILRNSKLVSWKKTGKQVFYSLQNDAVRTLIEKGMDQSSR
jgi:ArsR family transcriptional regulator